MKCKKCSSEAIIHLKQHNIALCQEHYEEFFYSRVKKAIKKYRMFGPDWKILVAVSGGKDSLVLWEVLNNLGYNAHGLYIDLGIGKYSEISKSKAISFAERKGLKLFVSNVTDFLGGLSTPEAAKLMRRKTCSVCGLVKRYVMNRFSHESSYDVIATGHNLDDEAATLFGNITHWQLGYLEKQYPVLPKTHRKLTPKVKPLILLSEREVATFALMKGIDYIMEECPASRGASSMLYKELLNTLEVNQPGTKHRFLTEYFKVRDIFSGYEGEIELKECSNCGYPTTQDMCSFCKLQEGIRKRLDEKKR